MPAYHVVRADGQGVSLVNSKTSTSLSSSRTAGGEDLIGWQVNRGWEQQADFFPASRFRERFNRPDIVRLALETLDEGEAVKRANAAAKRHEDTTPLAAKLPPVA